MTSFKQTAAPQHAGPEDQGGGAVEQGRQAATDVTRSATEHTQQVTKEAMGQARDLAAEARQRVAQQVGDQHRNAAANLRSLGSELGSMAERSEQGGPATELVRRAGERLDGVAGWLDEREPGDVLQEVKDFARRRPATFLLGALAAGVVVGRLTRGAAAGSAGQSSTPSPSPAPSVPSVPSGPSGPVASEAALGEDPLAPPMPPSPYPGTGYPAGGVQ